MDIVIKGMYIHISEKPYGDLLHIKGDKWRNLSMRGKLVEMILLNY